MEEKDKKFIKDRFRYLIDLTNKSDSKLSKEMGQSSQYLNQIVNGYKLPSLDGLYSFCETCNISLKDFFDTDKKYPKEYEKLIPYLNKLSPEELGEVTAIIKRIAGYKNDN